MVRSNLTTKFTIHNVCEYEKHYKENYKRENDEKFKGNVIDAITLGVIRNKKLPEVSDVITLIKLGNIKIPDDQAESILERWLEDDNNKKRGITGAFCDACNDLTIDLPLGDQFTFAISGLEENIKKQQDAMNNLTDLISKLGHLGDAIKNKDEQPEENKEEPVVVPLAQQG